MARCVGEALERWTYRHITLNRMTQWKWKMLPMPRAKHRTMEMMPALSVSKSDCGRSEGNLPPSLAHTIVHIYLRYFESAFLLGLAPARRIASHCCNSLKLRDRNSSARVIVSFFPSFLHSSHAGNRRVELSDVLVVWA